jgi:hypothetical protein
MADEFNYGNAWYFPHSAFAIYTIDGKLFKNVKRLFTDDETPEVVALPVGSYMIVARSEKDGISACPLSSRRASGRVSTWISEKRAH